MANETMHKCLKWTQEMDTELILIQHKWDELHDTAYLFQFQFFLFC